MAEQSQFSKLSKKQLVFICEKLVDEDFPIGNPYDSDFDSAFNILQEVSKYFSLTSTHDDFDSYDEEWVKDSAQQQNSDGNWSMWEGRERRDTEYENFEESDYSFGDVYEVNENKPQNESVLGRLVVENTRDVVKSLDKKTLLELRRIIDSKLRLL